MASPKEVEQLVIDSRAVMNGFCYAYTNALLQKLKELRNDKRIVNGPHTINNIAQAVIGELKRQVESCPHIRPSCLEEDLPVFIFHIEEFLNMFHQ